VSDGGLSRRERPVLRRPQSDFTLCDGGSAVAASRQSAARFQTRTASGRSTAPREKAPAGRKNETLGLLRDKQPYETDAKRWLIK
jgi:hypothetical protein